MGATVGRVGWFVGTRVGLLVGLCNNNHKQGTNHHPCSYYAWLQYAEDESDE